MNKLYYGDNLPIMCESIADESVDLIYVDPPFNSNRAYNVFFNDDGGGDSDAQIRAFDDTWVWGETTEILYTELIEIAPPILSETIISFVTFMGRNNLMAYLVNMAIRIVELHRVLKNTGSFYLHCDPTASHYLKIILDQIFGVKNFRNEIVWHYGGRLMHNKRKWNAKHDTIFYYAKSNADELNPVT